MNPENGANEETQTTAATEATAAKAATRTTVQPEVALAEAMPRLIREQIVENSYNKVWLYVWLVVDDWNLFEDEQACLRADGALDALEHLAINLGLADRVAAAADEGRRRLRENAQHSRDYGPARLEEINETLRIMASAAPGDSHYDPHLHSRLQKERARLGDDIRIASELLRYLEGEDIEHA